MVNESLMAAEMLAKEGIDAAVINIHTIKTDAGTGRKSIAVCTLSEMRHDV